MRVAAIDVGTNSVHLLVADIASDGEITFVEKAREQVELGRGGIEHAVLAEDAMQRGLTALAHFRDAIDSLSVEAVTATATSAVREAKNGSEWVRRVWEHTDIHVKVITGADEARLIYLGARNDLDFSRGYALILDLGGGSAELILCDSAQPLVKRSLPLGHIRLAERFGLHDPPSEEDWAALRAHVRDTLTPVLGEIPPGRFGSFTGTSGAVRTLARMATLARGEAVPAHEHGLILRRSDLKKLIQRFRSMRRARYQEIPGMDDRRRHTLPFAAAMVYEAMKVFGAEEVVASERSLRDGLLADWVLNNQPELALAETVAWPRMRAILRLMDRYEVDGAHAEQVKDLALSLFDSLQELHGLPGEARRMLEFAALLHDVGHHIAGEDHNKHGQYLIQHSRLQGFTAPDVAILGNVVRYHRGGRPKKTHVSFATLGRQQQRVVLWLSSILRVADGLDRSHEQPIAALRASVVDGTIHVYVRASGPAHLERWAVERRKALLERTCQRPLQVHFEGFPPGPATSDPTASDAEPIPS